MKLREIIFPWFYIRQARDIAERLNDRLKAAEAEREGLKYLLSRAHIRDPKTGRLLPRGKLP